MDKPIESLGKLFVTNGGTFDYSDNQKFYREKESEYERRAISSLLIGSGGGISLTLAYVSSNELTSFSFSAALSGIVLFLMCLLITGICQFAINESASLNFLKYTTLANAQNYEVAIQKQKDLERLYSLANMLIPEIGIDREKNSDARFEIVDKMNILNREAIAFGDKADKLDKLISKMRIFAGLFFLVAVIFSINFVLKGSL